MIQIIGWVGLALLLGAWVPQTWETIREGRTPVNLLFVILYVTSSATLTFYAILQNDIVFAVLNGLLTIGSGINLYYKLWPRNEKNRTGIPKSS
jgi:MtN3 and saliva related transmembrane protein